MLKQREPMSREEEKHNHFPQNIMSCPKGFGKRFVQVNYQVHFLKGCCNMEALALCSHIPFSQNGVYHLFEQLNNKGGSSFLAPTADCRLKYSSKLAEVDTPPLFMKLKSWVDGIVSSIQHCV